MSKVIYTGMWTFAQPGMPGRQFGAAGAEGPPEEAGTVRVSLDLRQVKLHVEDSFAYIELPEEWAGELARVLGEITLRMKHLRELCKLGLLAPEALHETGELQDAESNHGTAITRKEGEK